MFVKNSFRKSLTHFFYLSVVLSGGNCFEKIQEQYLHTWQPIRIKNAFAHCVSALSQFLFNVKVSKLIGLFSHTLKSLYIIKSYPSF